jgi:hypothetical protein
VIRAEQRACWIQRHRQRRAGQATPAPLGTEGLVPASIRSRDPAPGQRVPRRPPNIEIEIGTLSASGIAALTPETLGDSVRRELGALLQALPPVLDRGADIARVDGGSIRLSSSPTAGAVGHAVARAVRGGLGR